MARPGIEPRSSGPLANTLFISPIARVVDIISVYSAIHSQTYMILDLWRYPRSVVARVLDCDMVVNEFEFQSRY